MKQLISTIYNEGLNKRSWQVLDSIISPDYTGPDGTKGAAGFYTPVLALIKAFPDMQWTIDDLFGEGDKAVVRFHWEGTHTGTFTVYPATGKRITNGGIAIFSFRDGKVSEAQLQTDRLGFIQQVSSPAAGQPCLIDKFLIPANAKEEFYARMKVNRDFIKKLPGFIGDSAYTYTDEDDNLVCVTVARWQNMDAIDKAKAAVQEEYRREGFDMPGMLKRLNISIDRGVYRQMIEG